METVRSAASVEVSWRAPEPEDEDAEFLAAEKEAARHTPLVLSAPDLRAWGGQPDRVVPDVIGQVSGTRADLEQLRSALAGHVEATAGSERTLRAENNALRTELAEFSAVRQEATDLRAANVALQMAKADADAANAALAERNAELMETNANLTAEATQVWKEREFISPRDRALTFDTTCRLMDQMRAALAAKDRQNEALTAQIDELTAELEAARAAATVPPPPPPPERTPSTSQNTMAAGAGTGEQKLAVRGSVDLRDEVMAVAERLIQRSQSMSQQPDSGTSPRQASEKRSGAFRSTGDAPGSTQVLEALGSFASHSERSASPRHGSRTFGSHSEPPGSVSLTTSMVSPRTRTELAHTVMAERYATSRRRAEEEAAQRRDVEARWSEQRAAQEAAERKETEEKAQSRQAKRREIEKQRIEQERLRIEEEMAETRQQSAAARRQGKTKARTGRGD